MPAIRWISLGNKNHSVKVVEVCGNFPNKTEHFEVIINYLVINM